MKKKMQLTSIVSRMKIIFIYDFSIPKPINSRFSSAWIACAASALHHSSQENYTPNLYDPNKTASALTLEIFIIFFHFDLVHQFYDAWFKDCFFFLIFHLLLLLKTKMYEIRSFCLEENLNKNKFKHDVESVWMCRLLNVFFSSFIYAIDHSIAQTLRLHCNTECFLLVFNSILLILLLLGFSPCILVGFSIWKMFVSFDNSCH